jgi:hypothetical protein
MKAFKKVVQPGSTDEGRVFVIIEYRTANGKNCLRITGVTGPLASGNAKGSCGQNVDDLANVIKRGVFMDGWNAASVAKLAEVWERWHLNDMRAGCEHQRADWNPSEALEIVTYRLTSDAMDEQRTIERIVKNSIMESGTITLTAEQRAVWTLPFETIQAPDADGVGSGRYKVQKRETKTAGRVYPKEHPSGLLCKPCEVCGYNYGSAWLHEEVPEDVLTWLQSLPNSATPLPGSWAH